MAPPDPPSAPRPPGPSPTPAPLAPRCRTGPGEEGGCGNSARGGVAPGDESTQLGQRQAYFIRHDRTRGHTETRLATGLTRFAFGPGQWCFINRPTGEGHLVRTRPDIFIARDGDFRGNPTGIRRVHANAADWADDFANHEDRLATLRNRG